MHYLEMVNEGPSYAKHVKGPQLRLMHDLQHLDAESLSGSCTQLQTGMLAKIRMQADNRCSLLIDLLGLAMITCNGRHQCSAAWTACLCSCQAAQARLAGKQSLLSSGATEATQGRATIHKNMLVKSKEASKAGSQPAACGLSDVYVVHACWKALDFRESFHSVSCEGGRRR